MHSWPRIPKLPTLDCVEPITIRNNRWRCDHGWDIDLDDGSSNYHIYNNLCLNGGIKNREGYGRVVENNILVNNIVPSARVVCRQRRCISTRTSSLPSIGRLGWMSPGERR